MGQYIRVLPPKLTTCVHSLEPTWWKREATHAIFPLTSIVTVVNLGHLLAGMLDPIVNKQTNK